MNTQLQEFHEYILHDLFSGIPDISAKRMFGGFGYYKRGIIFAFITSESKLYFKVDDELKKLYKKYGSHPFIYSGYKNRKPMEMPYWKLPEEIIENREKLAEWIDNSVNIGKKSKKN